jgi:AcrR family transcriptional regulator
MDRRVKKTKAAIQEAYFSLLLEKDTPKISITELSERADIDRKTFYLHYSCVDDLATEAIEQQINQLVDTLDKDDYFLHPFELDKVFHAINQLIEQSLPLYVHIAKNDVFRDFWNKFTDILTRSMIDIYKDISSVSRAELEIDARFYSAGISAIYKDWLIGSKDVPIEQLGTIASRLIREGIPDYPKKS